MTKKVNGVCPGSGKRPAAKLGNADNAKLVCGFCMGVVSSKKDRTTVKHNSPLPEPPVEPGEVVIESGYVFINDVLVESPIEEGEADGF